MEGAQRALEAFSYSWIAYLFFLICPCCILQTRRDKLFKGRWLEVAGCDEPDLLIWENIGLKRRHRYWRKAFFIFIVIFMLLFCFYSVVFLENSSQNIAKFFPEFQCTTEVSTFEAELDASGDLNNGKLHCFCTLMREKEGTAAI